MLAAQIERENKSGKVNRKMGEVFLFMCTGNESAALGVDLQASPRVQIGARECDVSPI